MPRQLSPARADDDRVRSSRSPYLVTMQPQDDQAKFIVPTRTANQQRRPALAGHWRRQPQRPPDGLYLGLDGRVGGPVAAREGLQRGEGGRSGLADGQLSAALVSPGQDRAVAETSGGNGIFNRHWSNQRSVAASARRAASAATRFRCSWSA